MCGGWGSGITELQFASCWLPCVQLASCPDEEEVVMLLVASCVPCVRLASCPGQVV